MQQHHRLLIFIVILSYIGIDRLDRRIPDRILSAYIPVNILIPHSFQGFYYFFPIAADIIVHASPRKTVVYGLLSCYLLNPFGSLYNIFHIRLRRGIDLITFMGKRMYPDLMPLSSVSSVICSPIRKNVALIS